MEIKPIKNSREPNYPTIELFIKHPELLSKSVPNNWVKNKFVATSLAAFLLYGCGTNTNNKKGENIEIVDSIKDKTPTDTNKTTQIIPSEEVNTTHEKLADVDIAPIFAYGKGSGATGCIVMSPPVFLSEDEALSLIWKALSEEGYHFSFSNLPTFSLDVPNLASTCNGIKTTTINLQMDAYNPDSKWGIQFISISDFSKFRSEDFCLSSVFSFNVKKAAEAVHNQLEAKKETNAVVFYDPIVYQNSKISNPKQAYDLAIEESKKQLTKQVNDFIFWLKANNIKI